MNKYVIPVCLVREDVNWLAVIMARSISDCQDKLITIISEKCGIGEEFNNYREFRRTVDSKYDIINWRHKRLRNIMNLKVSMDLDGCLCDFYGPYFERFGKPEKDSTITRNVNTVLIKDKEFWMNLPVLNELNWTPRQYTTARVIRKQWIKEYLDKEMFPRAPIYQIHGYGLSKYSKVKMGGCHLHIDDSLSVFKDLNSKGIPCLLLDSPNNQEWGPIGRIYTLDKEEIEDTYWLFKDTLFPYFKELL